MIHDRHPTTVRTAFRPAQYITPFLLLAVADAGVHKAPASERPLLFGLFTVLAALGIVCTAVRLRRMLRAHRQTEQPAWTRVLGGLLGAYGLYVAYAVCSPLLCSAR
ncbi:hypothetical protein N4P33_03395 [Streptomyces sp. 15-116A]|uniref:hypothetical protein n=1 Tax=Streptomyces sp. 15-116A TaxID=2259035 RepID=UPI0021B29232|nr:hypothetical protein [Streptomyces sp. 15-116A]MCT7351215.1 hypothetical protein [Streptomyces sp. 15-116A]